MLIKYKIQEISNIDKISYNGEVYDIELKKIIHTVYQKIIQLYIIAQMQLTV